MKADLLYDCLIDAAVHLAKKHEPAVWREFLDYYMSMRRLRAWFQLVHPHIHPDKKSEEQRRDEWRRAEINIKIWLTKKALMMSEPVWPEADKFTAQLYELLFRAYRQHEITIFVTTGTGTEPLSPKVLRTKAISWCELAYPFDFATNTVECGREIYEVADVVIGVDAAAPDPERKKATASAPPAILSRTSPKKSAACPKIDEAMTAVYDKAARAGAKAPNVKEISVLVRAMLHAEGYTASSPLIEKVAAYSHQKNRRRKIGSTVANEKRRTEHSPQE